MLSTKQPTSEPVIPAGRLVQLDVAKLKPSPHNPRKLFDPEPLANLKRSIREHGVLVPVTVYKLPGQEIYAIVDGERRYKCCKELSEEGLEIRIPANVVAPPAPMASLIYMFNIHQFRQQWELMPTATALKALIDRLETTDTDQIMELTGLSQPQVERCKLILTFPSRYQKLSLDPDPKLRIPSNFWVELAPVLDLAEKLLPGLFEDRHAITDSLIDKYRKKRIKSVIHFRRILEAHDAQAEQEQAEGLEEFKDRLREYLLDPEIETRAAFDGFIVDRRSRQSTAQAVDRFLGQLRRARLDHVTDGRDEIIGKLTEVRSFVDQLLAKLEGSDPPPEQDDD